MPRLEIHWNQANFFDTDHGTATKCSRWRCYAAAGWGRCCLLPLESTTPTQYSPAQPRVAIDGVGVGATVRSLLEGWPRPALVFTMPRGTLLQRGLPEGQLEDTQKILLRWYMYVTLLAIPSYLQPSIISTIFSGSCLGVYAPSTNRQAASHRQEE